MVLYKFIVRPVLKHYELYIDKAIAEATTVGGQAVSAGMQMA